MSVHDRKKGIPLTEAPYYFAPSKLRSQYDNPTLPPPKLLSGARILAIAITEPDQRERFLDSMKVAQRYLDINNARNATDSQMRDRLLQAFGRRKLVAYGILLPRTRNSVPEKVPNDLLQRPFINWGKSSIKQRDFEYVSVRVYRPEWTTDLEKQSLQVKSRPIGRPSSGQAITQAIRALRTEGIIPTGSRKNEYEIIAGRTAQMYPNEFRDGKGLSDKTIAKYLTLEFRNHPPKRRPKP